MLHVIQKVGHAHERYVKKITVYNIGHIWVYSLKAKLCT